MSRWEERNRTEEEDAMRKMVDKTGRRIKFGIIGVLALIVLLNSVSYVPVQNYGIVFDRFSGGYSDEVEEPGIIFHLPFAQKVYDVESNAHTLFLAGENAINVQTKDGQKLATEVDVHYIAPKENAIDVFKYYQNNERDLRVNIQYKMMPVVQRAIEEVTTQYDVAQILGEDRAEIQSKIKDTLAEDMKEYYLDLTSFTLVSTDAEDGIENAINAEAVEQQQIKTSKQRQEKQKVENETKRQQVEAEAEQAKIKAEGEAEANRVINSSLSQEVIDYELSKARNKHGWVTTTGVGSAIVDTTE